MAKSFSQLVPGYKKRMMDIARDSSVELAARVYDDTPVDTALLESSWTPSLNGFDRSNSGGNEREVANQMKAGDAFTYMNTQPYVRVIEYTGHSPKAPNGMLHINVANWSAIVRSVA